MAEPAEELFGLPWSMRYNCSNDHFKLYDIHAADSRFVAQLVPEQAARRLVARVNACSGITTGTLESSLSPGGKLKLEFM